MVAHEPADPQKDDREQDQRRKIQNGAGFDGNSLVHRHHREQGLKPCQRAKHQGIEPPLGALFGRKVQQHSFRFDLGENPLPQPGPAEDHDAQPGQTDRQMSANRPQDAGELDRNPDQDESDDRQGHLPQGGEDAPDRMPVFRGQVVQRVAKSFPQRPAAPDQPQTDDEQDQHQRKVGPEIGAHLGLVPPRLHLVPDFGRDVAQRRDRDTPVGGVDRHGRDLQQLVRLAFAQLPVDFLDQPVRPAKGLVRGDDRRLQLGKLIVQLGPAQGDCLCLQLAVGGRRTQRVDLGAQRGNSCGIHVLRGLKRRAPFHQIAAHGCQRIVRCLAVLRLAFGFLGRPFPGNIIRWPLILFGCGGGGRLGPEGGRSAARPEQNGADDCQRADHGRGPDHDSSNTAGIVRGGASSHSGAGSPFSFRKAGL